MDIKKLVFFDKSVATIYVAKGYYFNPNVKSYVQQIKVQHPHETFPVEQVDMETISTKLSAAVKHLPSTAEASSMQKVATTLFLQAYKRRASDIHIRVSKRSPAKILFRVHNNLIEVEQHTEELGRTLCSAIYMSMCDVSDATYEENQRQDARISDDGKLPPGLDGIRVATSPKVDGMLMVLRLLYNDTAKSTNIVDLGFDQKQAGEIAIMKRKPTGINIIGGPTGSGKSTTLQRTLLSIHEECKGTKHIITVEDPPEYPMPGIVQTPVSNAGTEEERTIAFQAAIKAAMRLDPNVIMIGEMRDSPSVALGIRAAMTGHQVWSTIHANNAFAIIDRMLDLGVSINIMSDPSIITGLICQRLVKVLCPHCKVPFDHKNIARPQEDIDRIMGSVDLETCYVVGTGCPSCQGTGIAGRTVVAEVVTPDEKLMSYIRKGEKHLAIEYWRSTGGTTFLEHAISKINKGDVDPFQAEEEVGPLNMMTTAS
jgi:general secretion pathway protein E